MIKESKETANNEWKTILKGNNKEMQPGKEKKKWNKPNKMNAWMFGGKWN